MERPASELDVTHLRGSVAALIRASVLATLTEAQRKRLGETLPEDARAFLAQAPREADWVPTDLLASFLAEAQCLSPVRTARSRAQMEADVILQETTSLQGAPPEEVVARLPWFFAQAHRGGRVTLTAVRAGFAELLLQARYPYSDWYTDILPAWITRALVRAGASGAEVVHVPPGPGIEPWVHLYRIFWNAGS